MSIQILATKFFIPPLRSGTLPRPALIKQFNDHLDQKFTLISAPAGFGKSTFLSEWARTSNHQVVWISLDAHDNDVTRFWIYFITGINRIYEEIGGTSLIELRSQAAPSDELLTSLINEIATVDPDPLVVVLDDYHLIETSEIHDGLVFLVENCPPSFHIVIVTRSDPPFPLGRWRGRGELLELRTADLRFSSPEIRELFNDILELTLRDEDIEVLATKTEGWIAGLQMAAISMAGILKSGSKTNLSEFVDSFTGSHRFILDYLVEEVLNQQEWEVQDFLLQTAILERLTGSLCRCVTGIKESQKIIERLDRENLFVLPLDNECQWYRYHHLFRDLLRNQLQRRYPEKISSLHELASNWFEQNGWYGDALKHSLQMDDLDKVVKLVENNATSMIYHGELTTLSHWLDQLPDIITHTHPWLTISHSWALLFSGRLDEVEDQLNNFEEKYAQFTIKKTGTHDQSDYQHLNGHIAAINGHISYFKGDYNQAIAFSNKALELLVNGDIMASSLSTAIIIASRRWLGDLETATQIANAALDRYHLSGNTTILINLYFNLAKIKYLSGQLKEVYRLCQEALKLARMAEKEGRQLLFNIGYVYGCMSMVLLEWNNLDKAMRYAQYNIDTCKKWGQVDALADGHLQLARIFQVVGKHNEAIRAMQNAEEIVQQFSPNITTYMSANLAKLNLRQGQQTASFRWADECGLTIHDKLEIPNISLYLVLARVLIIKKKYDDVLDFLGRLEHLADETGLLVYSIEICILQAIAWQGKKDEAKALRHMRLAISMAKPHGFVRIFIDNGVQIQILLRRLLADSIETIYIQKLNAAIENETKISISHGNLVESLTARELEVLEQLNTPATHAEIAERLFISRNTVRSHIKNIYSKLDVNNRIQAIEKAREFELIS